VHERLDSTITGLLLREGGAKLIAVNSAHHPRRQRFTIAHELGHPQMHDGAYIVDSTVRINRRDDLSSMATDSQEIEANALPPLC
jgi:Zn-dependent peptidase ImmA (M78 family)